jgi:hypothetical protein
MEEDRRGKVEGVWSFGLMVPPFYTRFSPYARSLGNLLKKDIVNTILK